MRWDRQTEQRRDRFSSNSREKTDQKQVCTIIFETIIVSVNDAKEMGSSRVRADAKSTPAILHFLVL